ncbi:phytanoyl-CoA dioxygenase [bacterium]|nr:phytanoyl-CoA dioxygenase [bacterium]
MRLSADDQSRVANDGFAIIRGLLDSDALRCLAEHCAALLADTGSPRAGLRNLLGTDPILDEFSRSSVGAATIRSVLGEDAIPVRIIVFDKAPGANWSVPWHQDLNVAVRGTSTPEGYGPRTTKQGVPHIVPPDRILENMLTLRVHLDDCCADNGALEVAPGSHRHGKIPDDRLGSLARSAETVLCTASAGDALLMRPLLLHRSMKSEKPAARKILHIEYAAVELDGDLQWYFIESPKSDISQEKAR